MTTQTIIAYSLILLMILVGAAFTWWKVHQSPQRIYARRRARRQKLNAGPDPTRR